MTDMKNMFLGCGAFNQSLTGKLKHDMSFMFQDARRFNTSIAEWMSKVKNFEGMP